ncbi:MAG: hypothetical protein HKM02_04920 [Pseudomonadales bacterium]|nr:hypothetical protein [Pseudomonadales bacterium]
MKLNALYSAVALSLSLGCVAHADEMIQKAEQDINLTGNGASINLGAVRMTIGGFLAAETGYSNRGQEADITSSFSPIWQNNPAYYMSDYRMTARQSRLTMLFQGPHMDNGSRVESYWEGDFLGAAGTANSKESNSYTPRVRQLFVDYQTDEGFQLLAGQAWSLVTQDTKGISARSENVPLTIDAQYVPGFNWTRNPQIRLVQNLGMFTVAASAENPQALPTAYENNGTNLGPYGASGGSNNGITTSLPPGALMNPNTTYSTDGLPDFVAKVAFEPGYGHYELLALSRGFRDRINQNTSAGVAGGSNAQVRANSVGGSLLIPVLPKVVDFQASFLTGQGIGRYDSSQLNDYTLSANGSPSALKETSLLFGLVAHPMHGLDLYAYEGEQKVNNTDYYQTGTTYGGYGAPNCSATAFTCNVSKVQQFTFGGWYKAYQGHMGYVATGLQYSHTNYSTFANSAGQAPTSSMNVIMASLRFYPFAM